MSQTLNTVSCRVESPIRLRAVVNRECIRRLYATSTVEVRPFCQTDIGAKTVWSTLLPHAWWMVGPVELRQGVLHGARKLLSDDPNCAQLGVLNRLPTSCTVRQRVTCWEPSNR